MTGHAARGRTVWATMEVMDGLEKLENINESPVRMTDAENVEMSKFCLFHPNTCGSNFIREMAIQTGAKFIPVTFVQKPLSTL